MLTTSFVGCYIFSVYLGAMNATHAVACLALGFAALFIGALMKIMHWFGADMLQLAGMAAVLIGALLLVFRIFRSSKTKDLSNQ